MAHKILGLLPLFVYMFLGTHYSFFMTSRNDVLSSAKALISAVVHYNKFKVFGKLVIKLFLQIHPLYAFSQENTVGSGLPVGDCLDPCDTE